MMNFKICDIYKDAQPADVGTSLENLPTMESTETTGFVFIVDKRILIRYFFFKQIHYKI
jgi:hypothetical protein